MAEVYFHIDVNSAFLSWEACYRIYHKYAKVDLRTIPSVVGGNEDSRHGIVLAKSIPCKQYGIQTGESLMTARKKCPSLTVVPGNSAVYERCSKALVALLHRYSDQVEQYSIDECFIRMTGMEKIWGDPLTAAYRIKDEIEYELGFTVNVGISSNKLLAKMASEFKKPNKVHTLWPEEIEHKMWPLPVSELFYVGRQTAKQCALLGIKSIGDLAKTELYTLRKHMKSHGELVWNYANGRDANIITPISAPKNRGVGNSTTIPFDVYTIPMANEIFLSLAESVGMRLRKENLRIDVVAISIKHAVIDKDTNEFKKVFHQLTLQTATNITNEIYQCACRLFEGSWDGVTPVRALGIHTSRAKDNIDYRQLSFVDVLGEVHEGDINHVIDFEKMERSDLMVDHIRMRFGVDSIKRAILVKSRIESISGGKIDVVPSRSRY